MVLAEIKEVLKNYNLKPVKKLGQHFLIDKKYLQEIVFAGDLKKGDLVIEIGPGVGNLSSELLRAGAELILIEKDKNLVQFLRKKFGGQSKIKIVEGDFLKIEVEKIARKKPFKIISNIPYNITGQIIRKILELKNKPVLAVLTLQKEVAEKIIKKKQKENLLSLLIQIYGKAEIVKIVPAGAFWPKPKVQSAILKISFWDQPKVKETENFIKLLKIGFSSPRKKVITNLSKGYKIKKEKIKDFLKEIGLNPNARPENLSLNHWQNLFKKIKNESKK